MAGNSHLKKVGILGLQGCITPHIAHIEKLGAQAVIVRNREELMETERMILPGGESTTMLKLLKITGLDSALIEYGQNKPLWGICAGAILISKEVSHPKQESLGLIDIHAKRNHYGSQLDSFEGELDTTIFDSPIKVQFIRAPLLSPLNDTVKVLSHSGSDAVLMRQNRILVSAFHTELGEDSRLHSYFLSI